MSLPKCEQPDCPRPAKYSGWCFVHLPTTPAAEAKADPSPSLEAWERMRQLGYAPGEYMATCRRCEAGFLGDKRARTCHSCAVEMLAGAPSESPQGSPERSEGVPPSFDPFIGYPVKMGVAGGGEVESLRVQLKEQGVRTRMLLEAKNYWADRARTAEADLAAARARIRELEDRHGK